MSIYPSFHSFIHHSLHPYVDLQGDLFAASVAVDFENLREDYDDTILRLNESAVKRNVVYGSLEDEKQIRLFTPPDR